MKMSQDAPNPVENVIVWCCPACDGDVDENAVECPHCHVKFSPVDYTKEDAKIQELKTKIDETINQLPPEPAKQEELQPANELAGGEPSEPATPGSWEPKSGTRIGDFYIALKREPASMTALENIAGKKQMVYNLFNQLKKHGIIVQKNSDGRYYIA